MLRPVEHPAVQRRGDLVDAVGELEAAVLDVNRGIGERNETTVDVSEAGHFIVVTPCFLRV